MGRPKNIETIVDELRAKYTFSSPPLTTDVMLVLHYVAPSGKQRERKREVLRRLFPEATNNNGHHIADAVDNYAEF